MAAAVTGAKTITLDLSPTLTATALNALIRIAPENMTVAQVRSLGQALNSVAGGHEPTYVVGTLLV